MEKSKTVSKINLIFLHKLFKAIADSIIMVFIPVYILNITNDLFLAMGYLCIYSLFVILFLAILRKFFQKFGIIAIILHFLPIIGGEVILNFCPIGWLSIIGVALLMAIAQVLYSIPLNLIFLFGDKSTNVAKFQVATNVGKLIFILVSGYLLSSVANSFLYLCIASSFFYIICVIPIWFGYDLLKSNYEKLKVLPPKPRSKRDRLFTFFHASFGSFQATMDSCMPIFLFINGLSFRAVTFLMALVELFKILANYAAKFLVDRKKILACFIVSFIVFVSSIVCAIFVKNSTALYITGSLCSIAFPFTFVPAFKMFCAGLDNNANVFNQMTDRDIEIFSLRPLIFSASMLGGGVVPSLVLGIVAAMSMFTFEVLLTKQKDVQ